MANIKLVIFDIDGTLVTTRRMHEDSLNKALNDINPSYVLSKEEHLLKYDGLPTKDKLVILSREKGLPETLHQKVNELKQKYTFELLDTIPRDDKLIEIFKFLVDSGIEVHVASNSIRKTTYKIIQKLELLEYVSFIVSNSDARSKPAPDMYLQCMLKAGVGPKETLIVEDSYVGRQAVFNSGANLCAVKDPEDLTMDKIKRHLNLKGTEMPKWKDERLQVVIPAAGLGSRFSNAGHKFPKPLISVQNKPMIQVVVDNLNMDAKFIFIVQKEHCEKYNMESMLKVIAPGCEVVQIDGLTEGAACTVLKAEQFIDNDSPVIIANSDQFVEWDSSEFMYAMSSENIDGGILTFSSVHPKWSYVRRGEDGFICEVAEKKVISDEATVGIYYFKRGSDLVKSIKSMISNNDRHNSEYYLAPAFNYAIKNGLKIKPFKIDANKTHGLGVPEDLDYFLSLGIKV